MSIGLIVLALAFVFFLVVAYFAAQSWHWGHVVAMSFLFLFSLLFLFMASTLLRTHNKFRPAYERALSDYEQQVQRTSELTFGRPAEAAGEGTLLGERRLAQTQQASAGRRWGNVIARQFGPQGITVDMRRWSNDGCQRVGQEDEESTDPIEPEPDPAMAGDEAEAGEASAPADVAGHGVLKDQYVYVFQTYPVRAMTAEEKSYYFGTDSLQGAEFVDQDVKDSCRIPGAYLGKFIVVDAAPDRLTIKEAGELTNTQKEQINKGPKSWVLFEKLPTDTNELFAGLPDADRTKLLPMLLPLDRFIKRGIPLNPNLHRAIVTEYLRDGQAAEGRVGNPFRVRQTVKFVKDFEMLVDFEAEDLATDTPFSSDGRAQDKSLMQGGPVKFAVDDEITVDGAFASRLIRDGFAEAVGSPTYSRQLKDYQFLLNDIESQLNLVASQRNIVQDQVDDLNASLERLNEQLDKHVEELRLLEEDSKGFEAETELLKQFKKTLTERLAILRGEIETRSFASR